MDGAVGTRMPLESLHGGPETLMLPEKLQSEIAKGQPQKIEKQRPTSIILQ
jgi:hypothetical protein